jgi:cell division protein FtsN
MASGQPLVNKQLKIAESKTPPKPKFDFYTLLPNMEEVDSKETKIAEEEKKAHLASLAPAPLIAPVPPLSKPSEIPHSIEPVAQKPETFILQAAVFQSKQPAESLKAQLTLQGFEVKIEPYQKNSSPDTWYRVYLGPYKQESQAKLAQASLHQTAQIDSFVIKSKA